MYGNSTLPRREAYFLAMLAVARRGVLYSCGSEVNRAETVPSGPHYKGGVNVIYTLSKEGAISKKRMSWASG